MMVGTRETEPCVLIKLVWEMLLFRKLELFMFGFGVFKVLGRS